jgi:hypothetical protein
VLSLVRFFAAAAAAFAVMEADAGVAHATALGEPPGAVGEIREIGASLGLDGAEVAIDGLLPVASVGDAAATEAMPEPAGRPRLAGPTGIVPAAGASGVVSTGDRVLPSLRVWPAAGTGAGVVAWLANRRSAGSGRRERRAWRRRRGGLPAGGTRLTGLRFCAGLPGR